MKRVILVFVLFIGINGVSFSQEKFEKEYRTSATKIPEKALVFIKQFSFDKEIKWYIEESQLGKTYEAKGKLEKKKHSIEFDVEGNLLDVEIKLKKKKLSKKLKVLFEANLKDLFSKFKIKKIQRQLTGDILEVTKAIKTKSYTKVIVKYELVVIGEKDKKLGYYEVLMSANGKVEKVLKFIDKSVDNLEF